MTQLITLSVGYSVTASAVVDLSPKNWDDVDSWYVKWDKLHVSFKDGTDAEFELDSDTSDGIDMKRPDFVRITEGPLEFEKELAES